MEEIAREVDHLLKEFESLDLDDEVPGRTQRSVVLRSLEPGVRSPSTGRSLLEAFLLGLSPSLRAEVTAFLQCMKATSSAYNKLRRRQREVLQSIWEPFVKAEGKVYDHMVTQKAFLESKKQGYKMHSGPCRPSGTPQSVLHVILDCPTHDDDSFSHIKSPPLDSGNKSTNSLLGKGFKTTKCFLFDSFPRRVEFPQKATGRKRAPREIWRALTKVHDNLHLEYRKCGGKVTLIMGRNALGAYNQTVAKEPIRIERLDFSEAFEVWAERDLTTKERRISRIVVYVTHPSYILRFRKSSAIVTMDNGCNFAAALAGMESLLTFDYFTTSLTRQVSVPQKIPEGRKRNANVQSSVLNKVHLN